MGLFVAFKKQILPSLSSNQARFPKGQRSILLEAVSKLGSLSEIKAGPSLNAEFGRKDFFETASIAASCTYVAKKGHSTRPGARQNGCIKCLKLEMPKIGGLRSLISGNLGILAHFRHSSRPRE